MIDNIEDYELEDDKKPYGMSWEEYEIFGSQGFDNWSNSR